MDAQREMRRQDQYLRRIKDVSVKGWGGLKGEASSVCVFAQTCSSIGRLHNLSSLVHAAIHGEEKGAPLQCVCGLALLSRCYLP